MTRHSPIIAPVSLRRDSALPPADRFAFVLMPGFSMLALAGAIEPLRMTNQKASKSLHDWTVLSENGLPVLAAEGVEVSVQGDLASLGRVGTLIVIGGPGTGAAPAERLIAALRRAAAHGIRVGAICEGVTILARAGLLDGQDCAVHWQAAEGFAERFPATRPTRRAFTLGKRPTAAAGAVAGDLMLHLVAERHGEAEASQVADLMLHHGLCSPKSDQKVSVQSRFGVRSPRLARVLACMEENLEHPLSAQDIANVAEMSVRQTERLFTRYLKMTPMAFYAQMRLERGHALLVQTEMSITEIATACGFLSGSHFSKKYRAHYGVNPRSARRITVAAAAAA